jgi:hypothetical protein
MLFSSGTNMLTNVLLQGYEQHEKEFTFSRRTFGVAYFCPMKNPSEAPQKTNM